VTQDQPEKNRIKTQRQPIPHRNSAQNKDNTGKFFNFFSIDSRYNLRQLIVTH